VHKLQRVLNAATRVVTCTRKYDRGFMALMRDHLHWLDIRERITYKSAVLTFGRRSFSVMGPTVWNTLPTGLRAQQNIDIFRRDLKTFIFCGH
jgi:hypothetical protein